MDKGNGMRRNAWPAPPAHLRQVMPFMYKRCPDCGEPSNFGCVGFWHGPDDPWPSDQDQS